MFKRRLLPVAGAAFVLATSLTLAVGTANAAHPIHFDVAVTGTVNGQSFGGGTLEIYHFDSTSSGLSEQVVLHYGQLSVGYTQQESTGAVTSGWDDKQGQAYVSFLLPAIQTKDGEIVLDPITIYADQLPPGASGKLKALARVLNNPAAANVENYRDSVAALLNATFGLIPGAGPYY